MGNIQVNGDKDVVEKASAEAIKGRPTVESVLADFIIDNDFTVVSSEDCLNHARFELGNKLPGDRVDLALGFLAFSGLVSHSKVSGRVEVNPEKRETMRNALHETP